MNALLNQVKNSKKLADQTEDTGGFEYEPPAAGPCVARLVSYIETGLQAQRPRNNQPTAPCPEAILEFQLLGKKHAKEIEITNEAGEKVKKTIYPIVRETIPIKSNHRSHFYKLLQAMDYGRGNTHMGFMLGEGFKLNILHNEVEVADGKKRTYVNIRDDNGVWQIGAPVVEQTDDDGEIVQKVINVPEPQGVELRLLLQEDPSIEQWASIFIEGSYTKKDKDGNEIEVSKNWLQELCMKALDWEGSAVHTMVLEAGGDLPDLTPSDVVDEGDSGSDDQPEPEAPEEEKPAEKEADKASDAGDPLADLGL